MSGGARTLKCDARVNHSVSLRATSMSASVTSASAALDRRR